MSVGVTRQKLRRRSGKSRESRQDSLKDPFRDAQRPINAPSSCAGNKRRRLRVRSKRGGVPFSVFSFSRSGNLRNGEKDFGCIYLRA